MKKSDYADLFHTEFSLDPKRTGLLVIDMQYATACRTTGLGKLLKESGRAELGSYRFDRIENWVIPNISTLLSFFRKNRLMVIYVTIGSQLPDYSDLAPHLKSLAEAVGNRKGLPSHEILRELKPEEGESVVNKTTMSAFNSSPIDSVLRSAGITSLILTGVSTNSCVEGTGRDAADGGYACVIAEDACGAATQKLHEASLENFKRLLGRLDKTSSIIREMETALGQPKESEQ
jgi:nicotinamidase-related amidase